jgi:gas vesicle protein
MANGKKWAIGAVLAGIGGYVAGILTAPKSGKETRQDIKEEASKLRSEAEKKLKELHTELDVVLGQAKGKAADVKSTAGKAVSAAETAKDKAKEILSSIHSGEATNKDLDAAIKDAHKALDNLKKYVQTDAKK